MTNGRGAAMASFMTKKKKYKFQVELCLDELLEVPFVSAVLFAKLRLLDGGNFQDHSSREEVRDHLVKWGAKFSFPCKMLANATTGVLERCILRISVRKECKGGRSYTKLGFADFNLAQYAGAGLTMKTSILEGYDARHRQDNSLLKCSIRMNMIAGDVLFKVPSSPSSKHKSVAAEDTCVDLRTEELSSGSMGGSIASGSSGFGSLPKKRVPLLSSELLIAYTVPESNTNNGGVEHPTNACLDLDDTTCETGHSRNSSNTSQLSKASGYSSINSHSRQSSSGDSGHIRVNKARQMRDGGAFTFQRVHSFPHHLKIPTTIIQDDSFATSTPTKTVIDDNSQFFTPPTFAVNNLSASSNEEYRTPDDTYNNINSTNLFFELHKSKSSSNANQLSPTLPNSVMRSQSDFIIPKRSPSLKKRNTLGVHFTKPAFLSGFLTPNYKRKSYNNNNNNDMSPRISPTNSFRFKIPYYNTNEIVINNPNGKVGNFPQKRTPSLHSLQTAVELEDQSKSSLGLRSIPHRKLLEGGAGGGKLTPLAISPDETPPIVSSDCSQTITIRRPSVTTNPSSSSLVTSETGSLDRSKAAFDRRKKPQIQDPDSGTVSVRVENTRVNPDHLIAELLKNTNLEQADDSAENSGLQLFIAKDGTASLGNHEVKSQMSTGAQVFKQVVMDDNR